MIFLAFSILTPKKKKKKKKKEKKEKIIIPTQQFVSHKVIKPNDTQTNNKHYMIEFHSLPSYKFLDSLTAIAKLHARGWLVVSYLKEILGTLISS